MMMTTGPRHAPFMCSHAVKPSNAKRKRIGIQTLRFGEQQNPASQKSNPYKRAIFLGFGFLIAGITGNALIHRNFNSSLEKSKSQINSGLEKQIQLSKSVAEKLNASISWDQIARVAQKIAPATVRVDGRSSFGSGVIVQDAQGKRYVITNGFVTENKGYWKEGKYIYIISLYNGSDFQPPRTFEAGFAKASDGGMTQSSSWENDLALLEIPDEVELPANVRPIPFRNLNHEPLQPGEVVLSAGNPLGHRDNISVGIISHTDRQSNSEPKNRFVQTDAPSNRGCAGGGLFDMQGRLVGINTLGYNNAKGLALAIRIDIVDELLKGWGIAVQTL